MTVIGGPYTTERKTLSQCDATPSLISIDETPSLPSPYVTSLAEDKVPPDIIKEIPSLNTSSITCPTVIMDDDSIVNQLLDTSFASYKSHPINIDNVDEFLCKAQALVRGYLVRSVFKNQDIGMPFHARKDNYISKHSGIDSDFEFLDCICDDEFTSQCEVKDTS